MACYKSLMHLPLALQIGLRYTRAKRRNHFISFISLASMLGIALGVAVLITILSVMNGYDYEIYHRFFAVAPQVTVMTHSDIGKSWKTFDQELLVPGVKAYAPYIDGKGMLSYEGRVTGISVMGIEPVQEAQISKIGEKIVEGKLKSLNPGDFNMLIGHELAAELGVGLGDSVVLLTPQAAHTPLGLLPRYKRFTITGIFKMGNGLGFDNGLAYIHFDDAHQLFKGEDTVSGFHLSLNDIYTAGEVSHALWGRLGSGFIVTNWTEQFGAFFSALAMEKTMMFLILLLIIAVAAFNLVSSLVMVVNDKRTEIAILRTLGTSRWEILSIFVIQGLLLGVLGSILGLCLGVLLASNVTAVVDFLQHSLNVQLISSSVYYVDYLPSRIEIKDVIEVLLVSLSMSFIATLYPAYKASKTEPAEVLRYE